MRPKIEHCESSCDRTIMRFLHSFSIHRGDSDNADQRRYPRKQCDDSTTIVGEVIYKQSERI